MVGLVPLHWGWGCILGRAGDMTSSEVVLEVWWEAGGFRTSCSQQTEVFRIWPSHSADGHGWHGGRILVPPGRVRARSSFSLPVPADPGGLGGAGHGALPDHVPPAVGKMPVGGSAGRLLTQPPALRLPTGVLATHSSRDLAMVASARPPPP